MAKRPPPLQLVASWLRVSFQSFGGGTATLALIRQEFVTRTGWVEEPDLLRDWSMCQLAPGINLIALAILIGKRTGGTLGVLIAMGGLLVPSFAITLALTVAYARFMHTAVVSDAMKGILPAVAGIGLATAVGMGQPIARRFWEQDRRELFTYALLLALCLGAEVAWRPPTIDLLLGAGLVGAVINVLWQRGKGGEA